MKFLVLFLFLFNFSRLVAHDEISILQPNISQSVAKVKKENKPKPMAEDACTEKFPECDHYPCDDPYCCDLWDDLPPRCCLNGLIVKGEYLFWLPAQDGLDIAGVGSIFPGDIKSIEWDWTSGFRVGGELHYCDDWAIEILYTNMNPKGSKTVSDGEIFVTSIPQFTANGLIFTPFAVLIGEAFFNRAKAKVKLDYEVLDLELQKTLCFSPCFSLKFGAGLQGARIKEKFNAIYRGDYFIFLDPGTLPPPVILPFVLEEQQNWDFDGIGIKLGGSGSYHFCNCFHLTALGRIAILYGYYCHEYRQKVLSLDEDTILPSLLEVFREFYTIRGKEPHNDFATNYQLRFELGYETCIGRCYVHFSAGWEIFNWINLAQIRKGMSGKATAIASNLLIIDDFISSVTTTEKIAYDLGFQGLFVSLEFKF